MKTCSHKNKVNLRPFPGMKEHYYCPACGWHKYGEKEYSKVDWEAMIEGGEDV